MGADQGVGYLIQDARAFVRTEVVYLGIIIFAVAGKLSDSLVRLLEHQLLRWQANFRG
ncbi:putative aliphatic sulfonates transport permease protein SsuC [compost metagenome]